ncbi:aspartic proteinase-like protein 1 isoform X2 [Malania oleifera]|uniref:aspartic proteinase-like protein 1 isoform X2 n=1 Tax=Malania oleifera TaxID=397392 RepID=UPI0025AE0DF9|nr:aspartic proteinase-like protein 1 isoform X2 [Malania oleifera]
MATRSMIFLSMLAVFVSVRSCVAGMFSLRLIHRFSDEVKALRISRLGEPRHWPERGSVEYLQMLASSDLHRQKMKLGSQYQLIFPSEGSKTVSFGDELDWLYYTWIDIGTPKVSFLVALDSGSDLLWLPCDCIQCAPLSASNYHSLDRDLNEYSPSGSSTSKNLSCSHQLCDLGPNCKTSKQPCPYIVNYYSENTSSSGQLVEDILHLASGGDDVSNTSVQASVVIGCGRRQSGSFYSDSAAPDGLMGLGLGQISVPNFLAKQGLVRDSFSLCFNEDFSGRIFFGDQGLATQQSTPFLPLDGKYMTYIVGVDSCCIGRSCLEKTSFKALVDSGTSFTALPDYVYERVAKEFDSQVNAVSSSFEGFPWEYCYSSSSQDSLKIPSVMFMFGLNNSFVVRNPVFLISDEQGIVGFCLALQPADGDIGTIAQNFMTGYQMVFDRENLKLGWSSSNCTDLGNIKQMPLTPSPVVRPPNPLPTNEQQSSPQGHAVAPALAGRAPSRSSSASTQLLLTWCSLSVRSLLLVYLLPMAF